jgi:uncharacterized protein
MISSIVGGILIGLAASLALVLSGKATFALAFVAGLLVVGVVARLLAINESDLIGSALATQADSQLTLTSAIRLSVAGLLVGYGTQVARGCTSGHGVCGISRLSPRSFVATGVFLTVGIVTATLTG